MTLKHFYLIVFLSLFILNGWTFKENPKNDLKGMNLLGKVKSIKITYYQAEIKSGKIIKGSKRKEPYQSNEELIYFNNNGNINEIHSFNINSKLVSKKVFIYNNSHQISEFSESDSNNNIFKKIKYKYNNQGRLYTMTWSGQDYIYETKTIFKYDKLGNLIEEFEKGKDDTFKDVYKYDSNCYLIEESSFINNKLVYSSHFKYNAKGYKIENIYLESPSHNSKTTYTYNETGVLIEENFIRLDTNITANTIYSYYKKYDNRGNEIFEMHKTRKNDYKEKTYKYEFDSNNNWVEKIIFIDEIPDIIIDRKFEYYE